MDKFANIYVGDGLKDLGGKPFSSAALPEIQKEHASAAGGAEGAFTAGNPEDVTEAIDPSVQDEAAFEAAKAQADDEDKEDGDDEDGGNEEEGGDEEED